MKREGDGEAREDTIGIVEFVVRRNGLDEGYLWTLQPQNIPFFHCTIPYYAFGYSSL